MICPSIWPTPPAYLGETAALTAAFIWSFTMCIYRFHGQDLSANAINLFKNVVAFACLIITITIISRPWPSEPHLVSLLMLSGVIGLVISDSCMFAALKRLGAQTTAAILCLAPPLAAVLAWFVHDEVLSRSTIIGMTITVLSVAGVILMSHSSHLEDGAHRKRGIMLALLAALAQAVGMVLAKGPFKELDPMTGEHKIDVFMGTLIRITPAVAVLLLINWHQRARANWSILLKPKKRLAYLLLASLFGSYIGLLLLTTGITFTSVGVATTLSATFPIWIIPISYFFLSEQPRLGQVICTLTAVAGVALLMT